MGQPPSTRHNMLRADYELKSTAHCKGCDAPIEWWKTTNGKMLPVNVEPIGEYVPVLAHWATCPKRDEFRTGSPKAKTAAPPASAEPLAARRERLVATLRETTQARVIVAIYDDITTFSYQDGVPPEDLRNDLIGAANTVRNHITRGEQ